MYGNRPAGLGGLQRPGVPDLRAERHAEIDAGGVQRVVAAVGRRRVPQPRDHPQSHEAVILDAPAQLAHALHRPAQVDRREAGEAVGVRVDPAGDLRVGDQRAGRSVPRAQQAERHPAGVHRGHGGRDGNLLGGQFLAGPAAQRVEHLAGQEPRRRMLHPHVDRHPTDPMGLDSGADRKRAVQVSGSAVDDELCQEPLLRPVSQPGRGRSGTARRLTPELQDARPYGSRWADRLRGSETS